MAVQQAFCAEITLAFDYKETESSKVERETIETERISYVMIERMYENVNILPVIYVSLSLSSQMYSKVINSYSTSKFYLKIRKRNKLSNTSLFVDVVNDTFSYVTSTTSPNLSKEMDNGNMMSSSTYKTIMIGLVSSTMTDQLRTPFNGIYNNIKESELVKIALDGLKNVIMQDLEYDNYYKTFLIPPVTSRYKLLSYIFEKDAFYNSMFEFFMDFDNTYLLSKNGEEVKGKDTNPNSVIIQIKNYTAQEAYTDGYTIKNGAYVVYVNGANTKSIINTSIEKATNKIVSYSEERGTQKVSLDNNDSSEKISFVRTQTAGLLKNEIQSNLATLELVKQNIDGSIFTPNKSFHIQNYDEYEKYNGKYFLSYKKEFFYHTSGDEFIVSCNVGLKRTNNEENAYTDVETTKKSLLESSTSKKSVSSSKKSSLNSVIADRSIINKKDNNIIDEKENNIIINVPSTPPSPCGDGCPIGFSIVDGQVCLTYETEEDDK